MQLFSIPSISGEQETHKEKQPAKVTDAKVNFTHSEKPEQVIKLKIVKVKNPLNHQERKHLTES